MFPELTSAQLKIVVRGVKEAVPVGVVA